MTKEEAEILGNELRKKVAESFPGIVWEARTEYDSTSNFRHNYYVTGATPAKLAVTIRSKNNKIEVNLRAGLTTQWVVLLCEGEDVHSTVQAALQQLQDLCGKFGQLLEIFGLKSKVSWEGPIMNVGYASLSHLTPQDRDILRKSTRAMVSSDGDTIEFNVSDLDPVDMQELIVAGMSNEAVGILKGAGDSGLNFLRFDQDGEVQQKYVLPLRVTLKLTVAGVDLLSTLQEVEREIGIANTIEISDCSAVATYRGVDNVTEDQLRDVFRVIGACTSHVVSIKSANTDVVVTTPEQALDEIEKIVQN